MVNLARSKSDQPTVEIFTIELDLPDAHIFHRYLSEPDCYSRNGQDHHGSTHPNSRPVGSFEGPCGMESWYMFDVITHRRLFGAVYSIISGFLFQPNKQPGAKPE
jgi:hypothetical protein